MQSKTTPWKRILLSDGAKADFAAAMEKADVPDKASTAVLVETLHESQKDTEPHYTTVYLDKDDKDLTTKHIYP
ncbi:hypothetical protein BDP55DRAFT_673984 [Colletotrichum godetiae]|uniref:Uncharacterized protein n=1 Tax=Colletotrichum godetiae TaxID=1209918 RepID=A0AAJ0AIB4_9PEZI|nr:uncharacterized protein BDP55DRAFT_673984 [Colletotrichum godetiae]KAK1672241.1 hypothetical protein BDP55DRAFT_673984 [Colletotrichum godetiae]